MSTPRPIVSRAGLTAAVACFFLSGVAGLLYEVVWTRMLGVMFGHTVHAITAVLAAYMGGLALGAVLVGRRADGMARPLRVYGLLEAGIGLYCAATPLLFAAANAIYLSAHRALDPSPASATVLHLLLAAALLLPPTTLMGATLPILSRAIVREHSAAASQVGTLYAVNTWGAVAGTAATGFFLLPAVGLQATIWIGVGLNFAVAATAILVERRPTGTRAAGAGEAPGEPAGADPAAPGVGRVQVVAALVAIGVSGAASMAYQVSWTRALSLVLGSSTYAFTAMLTTFLVGLALGAVLVSRVLRRRRAQLAAFGWVEVAIAFAALATLPMLGRLPDAVLAVLGWTGVSLRTVLGAQFALSFGVVIVPTLLVGATFPLVVAALERGLGRLGRDVGAIYGANTIGTIAGSIAAGFVLIRLIGIQNTVMVAAAANLVAGLAVVLVAPGARGRVRVVAAAAAAGFVGLAAVLPHWDPKVMTAGVGVYAEGFLNRGGGIEAQTAGQELLFYDEGISTTVSVSRDPGATVLTVNGKVDASNDVDMATQLLSGHLPMLLHPRPERALVIGLASGVTVGAVAQHPARVIDVAELEPAMRQASAFFLAENRNALADPRVRVIEGDGRSILATAREPYDVIISEPSNPWIAGVASLFTLDFYRAARARLAPDGIFVQWLQNYSILTRDMQMVVRTFQEVFPHVSIWAASSNDFLLVATPAPVVLDLDEIARRAGASPLAREDMERFGWLGDGLVHRFFLGEEDARRYAAGAPFNTDDLPTLEFSAPLALYGADAAANEQALRSFRTVDWPTIARGDPARFAAPLGRLAAARAYWRSGHLAEARHRLAGVTPEAAGDPRVALARSEVLMLLGQFDEAHSQLAPLATTMGGDPAFRRAWAAASALREPEVRRQLAGVGGGIALRDALAEIYATLARERRDPAFWSLALEQLGGSIAVQPGAYATWNNAGWVLRELGDLEGAARAMRRAVELDPEVASTRYALGVVLGEAGRRDEARVEFEAAARLEPGWTKPLERLRALGAAR